MELSGWKIPTIRDVREIKGRGPWGTKSGGKLDVLLSLPLSDLRSRYFSYRSEELEKVPADIRGLRVYMVHDLPLGRIGGTEYHRVREEAVLALNGSVRWTCEDLSGGKSVVTLQLGAGIWMPPFMLHTYEVLEEGSALLVVANTLFIPEDPRTHDTYSIEEFRVLQSERGHFSG
jgi:dTDP-4-dehydrorhamnose 3,5-epimerase-like enzyme